MKKLLLILLCLPFIGFGQCVSGDCENGYGEYIFWVDGSVESTEAIYKGEFENGKLNGKGNIVCDLGGFEGDAGDYYIIGNWKNGKLHGNSITVKRWQSYQCGDVPPEIDNGDTLWASVYESTYSTLLHETIIKYSGQYKDSLLNGFGFMSINSFRYTDDDIYDETYSEIYIGQWDEGLKNGFGRYFYKNGDIYEGDWIKDKKEGNGTIIKNDGEILKGAWENDIFKGEE